MKGREDKGPIKVGRLTLSRRIGECIVVGDEILIKVVDIRKGCVKIGIMAPKEVVIYREEVLNTYKRPTPKEFSEGKNNNTGVVEEKKTTGDSVPETDVRDPPVVNQGPGGPADEDVTASARPG